MPRLKVKQVDGALPRDRSEESLNLSADEPHLVVSSDIVHITQSGGSWAIQGVDDSNTDAIVVHNDSSVDLTIPHESASAQTTSERINCPESNPLTVPPDGWVQLVRHPGGSRWMAAALQSQYARGLRETGGPTFLSVGAVADGEYLQRSGSALVGGTPSGGSSGGDALIRRDGSVMMRRNGEIYTARS